MAATFHLTISSPEKLHFDGSAVSLTVPGEAGSLCLLAHHAPLAAVLGAGTLVFRAEGESEPRTVAINGTNFLSFSRNQATVLLD